MTKRTSAAVVVLWALRLLLPLQMHAPRGVLSIVSWHVPRYRSLHVLALAPL
jgi:hypothetical protein